MSDFSSLPVPQAIKDLVTDPRTALSLLLGSRLEGGWGPTYGVGDSGTSFGPFQMHEGGALGDLPGSLAQQKAEAQDPVTALKDWAIPTYSAAVASIPSELWTTNPELAAMDVAVRSERPAQPYNIARGQATVDAAYQAASQVLNNPSFSGSNASSTNSNTTQQASTVADITTVSAQHGLFYASMYTLHKYMNPSLSGAVGTIHLGPLDTGVPNPADATLKGFEDVGQIILMIATRWIAALAFGTMIALGGILIVKQPVESAAGTVLGVKRVGKGLGVIGGANAAVGDAQRFAARAGLESQKQSNRERLLAIRTTKSRELADARATAATVHIQERAAAQQELQSRRAAQAAAQRNVSRRWASIAEAREERFRNAL